MFVFSANERIKLSYSSIIITIFHCCPSYSSLTLLSGIWLRRTLLIDRCLVFQYILLCVSSSLASRGQLPLSLKVQQMQRCISTLDLLQTVCAVPGPPLSPFYCIRCTPLDVPLLAHTLCSPLYRSWVLFIDWLRVAFAKVTKGLSIGDRVGQLGRSVVWSSAFK